MANIRNSLMLQSRGGIPASIWLGVRSALVIQSAADTGILTELGIQILTEDNFLLETEAA